MPRTSYHSYVMCCFREVIFIIFKLLCYIIRYFYIPSLTIKSNIDPGYGVSNVEHISYFCNTNMFRTHNYFKTYTTQILQLYHMYMKILHTNRAFEHMNNQS